MQRTIFKFTIKIVSIYHTTFLPLHRFRYILLTLKKKLRSKILDFIEHSTQTPLKDSHIDF